MSKFLDDNGLLYLWTKIKGILPKKTSDLVNDSGFITGADVPEGAAASTTTPKMAGTATAGSEMAFARGDHVHPSDSTKVDKVTGKGLSTNDLTTALKENYDAAYAHSQVAHAPASAEKNIIIGIQRNGTDLNVDTSTRKVNVSVPTKVSELTNDTGFITVDEVPETYELPAATASVLGGVTIGTNITVSSGKISVADGSTSKKGVLQLTDGVTSTSTTTAATPKAVKQAYDLANGKQSPATTLAGYGITDAYTKGEVDSAIAAFVDSAPDALNTLNELAAALGDDANFATTINNKIAGKADISELSKYVAIADAIATTEIDAICV